MKAMQIKMIGKEEEFEMKVITSFGKQVIFTAD